MEKHKCKLCLRSFSNGRALGGHMRSHMMNLPVPPKEPSAESASSQSLSLQQQQFKDDDEEEEEEEELLFEDDEKSAYYGLRENPKRSVKLVDPEFSLVILQDRESETESSKNPTRRRSKRPRKPDTHLDYVHNHHHYLNHFHDKPEPCWTAEPEPMSSVSDATTEEDVAFCLMMMSRDNWPTQKYNDDDFDVDEDDEEEEEEDDDDDESEFEEVDRQRPYHQPQQQVVKCPRNAKYKCETCNKVFRSYQALGGHRASHKKIKLAPAGLNNRAFEKYREINNRDAIANKKKVHQCPVCFREFSSGQALGGHKRSHITASHDMSTTRKQPPPTKTTTTGLVTPVVTTTSTTRVNNKIGEGVSLIDLNLPAPDYDDNDDDDYDHDHDHDHDHDEISQNEVSAVSDAEFVNSAIIIRQ